MANQNSGDVSIFIACDRRSHTWAFQLGSIASSGTIRGGSLGPREAAKHTLLSIATIAALRSFGGKKLKHVEERVKGRKPVMNILTDDIDFAGALKAFMGQPASGIRFKAGRGFWKELKMRLDSDRVNIQVELVAEDDVRVGILRKWAKQFVAHEGDLLSHVPAVFLPTANAILST